LILLAIVWVVFPPRIAKSQTALRVDVGVPDTRAWRIPQDFAGLSFESSNLLPDKDGNYLFSGQNKQMVDAFTAIGIKSLRVGGGTADDPRYSTPTDKDIDQLFSFAKAAGVKIIYTLRLLNGDPERDAKIAKYIVDHYNSQLTCFEIGNEPDWHSYHNAPDHLRDPRIVETEPGVTGSAFPSYIKTWNQFADAIEGKIAHPRYAGPDTGSNYPVPGTKDTDFESESWTQRFAEDVKGSGTVIFVTQHDYAGESAIGVSVNAAIEAMLSPEWPNHRYELLFDHVLRPVEADGLSYRMTEANDYTGGVDGASNAFASALWALDYLHWHAAHNAIGVNFHNKRWIYTDTIYLDLPGALHINPKAYAIKAFSIGGQGLVAPVKLQNPTGMNITVYAVQNDHSMFVTIINKEHGKSRREARVLLHLAGVWNSVQTMSMLAPKNDAEARENITLGGAEIKQGSWQGKWEAVGRYDQHQAIIDVPASSAVIVKFGLH
jgi:hypothetical protein